MMDYYEIGQRIRKIRRARGLSQEELAEQVDISTTHMSHIETGNTKLSLPVFVDLARALEVRPDEFLGEDTFAVRSAALGQIADLLEGCSTQQIKVIEDVVRATAEGMKKYL